MTKIGRIAKDHGAPDHIVEDPHEAVSWVAQNVVPLVGEELRIYDEARADMYEDLVDNECAPTFNKVDLMDCARGFHSADESGETCTVCGEDISGGDESGPSLLHLDLTDLEKRVLAHIVANDLRDKQGDGFLSDDEDDALVSLNDKIEAALGEPYVSPTGRSPRAIPFKDLPR